MFAFVRLPVVSRLRRLFHSRALLTPQQKAERNAAKKQKIKKFRRLDLYVQANWRCAYCDADLLRDPLLFATRTVDHVVPKSSPLAKPSNNLVPSCHLCNSLKSNAHFGSIESARRYISERRALIEAHRQALVECGGVPPADDIVRKAEPVFVTIA